MCHWTRREVLRGAADDRRPESSVAKTATLNAVPHVGNFPPERHAHHFARTVSKHNVSYSNRIQLFFEGDYELHDLSGLKSCGELEYRERNSRKRIVNLCESSENSHELAVVSVAS